MDYFEFFTPEGKGIIATLRDGVVMFAIEAGPDSSVRGTEMFNRMIDAFGANAKAIRGVWIKGKPDSVSTNIDKVNELTALGMALEEAVLQTWTVTRAVKRGFTQVSVEPYEDKRPDLPLPRGVSGAYTRIEVMIQRGE